MNNFFLRLITATFIGLVFWTIFSYLPPIAFSLLLGLILLLIIIFEWGRIFPVNTVMFWLTLPWYPVLPFALLIVMNHHIWYRELLFILFVIVFSFDTGSYIAGNIWGKNLIYASISPRKTWEGFIGGYIFAIIGLIIVLWEQQAMKQWWFTVSFALLVCFLSLMGDMFESWLKRRAHIKDSGTLLPGHGGFLDRFDGILFTVFFFYILRDYLVSFFYF